MAEARENGEGKQTGTSSKDRKKLLDQVWDMLMAEGMEEQAASRYVSWIRNFILYHDKRHPMKMGMPEIDGYLGSSTFHGSDGRKDRAEAERALEFLYVHVLGRKWPRNGYRKRGSDAKQTKGAGKTPETGVQGRYVNGQRRDVKLLDRVRDALRVGQYALDTEKTRAQGHTHDHE